MGLETFIKLADKILGTQVMEYRLTRQNDPQPFTESSITMGMGTGIAIFCFLVIGAAHLLSDLGFEECQIIYNYIKKPISEIFLTPSESESPILYLILLWIWYRALEGQTELFFRLPSLFFTLATLFLVFTLVRRLFRHPTAGFFAVSLMCFSPVYINFFHQVHGYSLSILLALFACGGILYILREDRTTGTLLFALGSIPLSWLSPWHVLYNISLIVFLAIFYYQEKRFLLNLIYCCILFGIGIIGLVFYFPFIGKLWIPIQSPSEWYSPFLAIGHWFLVIIAHSGLFILGSYGLHVQVRARYSEQSESGTFDPYTRNLFRYLPIFLLISIIIPMITVVVSSSYLNCLPFLAPLTISSLSFFDYVGMKIPRFFFILLLFILGNFLIWTRFSSFFEARDRQKGILHANFLQQFDVGKRDFSSAVHFLHFSGLVTSNTKIFVPWEFYPTFLHYWRQTGRSIRQIECIGWEKRPLQLEKAHYLYLPKIAITYVPELFQNQLRKTLEAEVQLQIISKTGDLYICRLVTPYGFHRQSPFYPQSMLFEVPRLP